MPCCCQTKVALPSSKAWTLRPELPGGTLYPACLKYLSVGGRVQGRLLLSTFPFAFVSHLTIINFICPPVESGFGHRTRFEHGASNKWNANRYQKRACSPSTACETQPRWEEAWACRLAAGDRRPGRPAPAHPQICAWALTAPPALVQPALIRRPLQPNRRNLGIKRKQEKGLFFFF